jgi:hypothetical protein
MLVVLGRLRPDLALCEVMRQLAQSSLLVCQREGDTGTDCLCRSHFRSID